MLLAVDTSTDWIGIALHDGVRVIGETVWRTQNAHSVELAPGVQALLERCHVQPREISLLGVALGPGSYTSLRIGLAFVKGFALTWHLPVLGEPSLDVLAAAQPVAEQPLVAVLQAGRSRLAAQWYQASDGTWRAEGAPELLTAQELSRRIEHPTLVCGELGETERRLLQRKRKNCILASPAQSLRRPSFLAELAWVRYRAGEKDDLASLAPIYLRTPGVEAIA
jgi:tRNA threonylcarbamoyladenosine biosynthesis protein TsaB